MTGDETTTAVTGSRDACPAARSDDERAVVELWAALQRATNLVRARLEDHIDVRTGMLPDEVELLLQLAVAPERRLRMVDVSEVLQVSKSGVTRLVDRLEERGYVLRAACPSDRRVVYAGITDEGLRALDAAGPAFVEGLMEHLGRRLSAAQVAAMGGDLRRILAADADGASVLSPSGRDTAGTNIAGPATSGPNAFGPKDEA